MERLQGKDRYIIKDKALGVVLKELVSEENRLKDADYSEAEIIRLILDKINRLKSYFADVFIDKKCEHDYDFFRVLSDIFALHDQLVRNMRTKHKNIRIIVIEDSLL